MFLQQIVRNQERIEFPVSSSIKLRVPKLATDRIRTGRASFSILLTNRAEAQPHRVRMYATRSFFSSVASFN